MRVACVCLVVAALLAGCDDDLGLERQEIVESNFTLYSLARPELVAFPSAFDFFLLQPVRIEGFSATGNWDVGLTENLDGFALIPPEVFSTGQPLGAGVARVEGTFDAIIRAPGDDAFVRDQLVPLDPSAVYVVRTRDLSGCVNYAKVRAVNVNVGTGAVAFEYLLNPNCGDRSLVPDR